jgi:hypothetical protein
MNAKANFEPQQTHPHDHIEDHLGFRSLRFTITLYDEARDMGAA